jgi:two-component system, NtrC family, response regulator GlrR
MPDTDDIRDVLLLEQQAIECPLHSRGLLRTWIAEEPHARRAIVRTSADAPVPSEPCCIIAQPSAHESFAALYAAIRRRWPPVPLLAVFCRDWTGLEGSVRCMNDGIDDFLRCPFGKGEMIARLQRLLAYDESARPAGPAARRPWQPETLVGHSPKFLQVLDRLQSISHSDAIVLLLGETGTGKEVFGRAIHYLSARRGYPFIPVNCGSLPDNLLENELFGHMKGAYTDASSRESGLLRAAEGGTLFLDEVDSLSMGSQVKLLRFLQDHEYRPLGSSVSLTANVRVVAATNTNLRSLVEAKSFREDLFYRLNVLSLRVPPLRDRPEDIPLLAAYFLQRFRSASQSSAVRFSPAVIQKLLIHGWPGNIRELEGVIHRAVVMCRTPVISASDIDFNLDQRESNCRQAHLKEAKQTVVEHFERLYLIGLLDNHGGNVSHAAREAGKERRSFQRLVKKYNLNREQFKKTQAG